MTKEETLHAAEVMRRAANGEIVQCSGPRPISTKPPWTIICEPSWDFAGNKYRILPLPDPPKGQSWHNPDNLNATQVGVHEGWRLLTDKEYNGGSRGNRRDVQYWYNEDDNTPPSHGTKPCWDRLSGQERTTETIRTKAPLPPIDPDKEAMEAAMTNSDPLSFERGWKACKEHYKKAKGIHFFDR